VRPDAQLEMQTARPGLRRNEAQHLHILFAFTRWQRNR
jgi:hypothetical protein